MGISTAIVRQHTKQLAGDVDRLLEDPERRDVLRAVLTRLDKVAASSESEESKIKQDARLWPEGQRAQLKDLASKKADELKFFQDELVKINTSYQFMSDSLFTDTGQAQLDRAYDRQPVPLEENPVLAFLRQQEIRTDWKLKSQPERDAEYLRAVQAGDREIVKALSSAPGHPVVTPSLKVRADYHYAEQNFPAAFKNFGQISALREQLKGLSDLTTKWLDGLGAQP